MRDNREEEKETVRHMVTLLEGLLEETVQLNKKNWGLRVVKQNLEEAITELKRSLFSSNL